VATTALFAAGEVLDELSASLSVVIPAVPVSVAANVFQG